MKSVINGIDCGSVKTASVSIKPVYKEHKTSYPQVTDVKTLMYTESICKVESEETVLFDEAKQISIAIISGEPKCSSFTGLVPGLGGTALTVNGNGFGSSIDIGSKMSDFGSIQVELTCLDISMTGSSFVQDSLFIMPDSSAQAITIDSDNLIFGAPSIDNELCNEANFVSSCKVKYITTGWPPTIDAMLMDSHETYIKATVSNSSSSLLVEAVANLTPGLDITQTTRCMSLCTVGGSTKQISMLSLVEPDIAFTPGNDWNGISIKLTAILNDPTKIGTNWAQIA